MPAEHPAQKYLAADQRLRGDFEHSEPRVNGCIRRVRGASALLPKLDVAGSIPVSRSKFPIT
jgi:hypothetical protein